MAESSSRKRSPSSAEEPSTILEGELRRLSLGNKAEPTSNDAQEPTQQRCLPSLPPPTTRRKKRFMYRDMRTSTRHDHHQHGSSHHAPCPRPNPIPRGRNLRSRSEAGIERYKSAVPRTGFTFRRSFLPRLRQNDPVIFTGWGRSGGMPVDGVERGELRMSNEERLLRDVKLSKPTRAEEPECDPFDVAFGDAMLASTTPAQHAGVGETAVHACDGLGDCGAALGCKNEQSNEATRDSGVWTQELPDIARLRVVDSTQEDENEAQTVVQKGDLMEDVA